MYNGIQSDFVYFKNNKKNYTNWENIEQSLSQSLLSISDVNKINQIVKLIKSIATNERIKELHSISNYFKKYKNELAYLKNGSRIMSMINNPTDDPKAIKQFYEDFVLAINLARRDTEETLTKIRNTKRDIDEATKKLYDYAESDYRFAIGKHMTNLIKRITGEYQINSLESSSLDSQIEQVVINILLHSNIIERVESGEDFSAIASIILIDVEQQAQKILDEYMKKDSSIKSFRDIATEIFPQIEKEYIEAIEKNKPQTEIQKAIMTASNSLNDNGLSTAIRNTEEILNIHLSNNLNLGIGRLRKIEKVYSRESPREESKIIEDKLNQLRTKISSNPSLAESLFRIEFTRMDASSSHGNLNELIEGLFGEKVRANVATDIITYHFGWKIKENNQQLNNFMHEISESLSAIGDYLSKNTDRSQFLNELHQINNQLTDAANKIEQFLISSKDINDKIFIQHETLKLSILGNKQGHGFKGRTMSIFSYIDYLSSAMIGGNLNIDNEELKFLAYNIIPGAIAEDYVGPLERYFSLFAALLMFDDVENMASEAIKHVQSLSDHQQVEQLHLYNLNGMYVPASMVLEYTSEGMNELATMVEMNYAAQAHIKIVAPAYGNYIKRASLAKNTSVNITFLSGFTNLINNLFNAIS